MYWVKQTCLQSFLTKFCTVINYLLNIISRKFCLNQLRFSYCITKCVGLQFFLRHTVYTVYCLIVYLRWFNFSRSCARNSKKFFKFVMIQTWYIANHVIVVYCFLHTENLRQWKQFGWRSLVELMSYFLMMFKSQCQAIVRCWSEYLPQP